MDIQTFRPSLEEFRDFSQFIEHMEQNGAHAAGLAKVIPPQEWINCHRRVLPLSLSIEGPLRQSREELENGGFLQFCHRESKISVMNFKTLAEEMNTYQKLSDDTVESLFWQNLLKTRPLYGADVSGSLFRKSETIWNFNTLPCILKNRHALSEEDIGFAGILKPYLYFGMQDTAFAYHCEDMDLYSVNAHHRGAKKLWYAISPKDSRKFKLLVDKLYEKKSGGCKAFIRHKQVLIPPWVLENHGIKVNKIIQNEGEIIVTFPLGFHAGFNFGFNCNEAVNFALPRWIDYAKKTDWCDCRRRVVFPIDGLIKYYQPEKYEEYITGNDSSPHPEYPDDQTKYPPITKQFVREYQAFWDGPTVKTRKKDEKNNK